MNTYLVRFSTNGIDQDEYTLTTLAHMTRNDFTEIARQITEVVIEPETITVYRQIYP